MSDGGTLLSGNTVRPLSEPVHGTVTEANYPQMVAQVRLAIAQGSMCNVDLRDLAPHRKLSFMRAIHRTSDLNRHASSLISQKLTPTPKET